MALRYRFTHLPTPLPVPSLGGISHRSRALAEVALIAPTGTKTVTAMIDHGSDDCVFSVLLAAQIGMDLSTAPVRTITRVTGSGVVVAYAQIVLRMTDGIEFREWPAWVSFTAAPLARPLLGFAGCLQFFDVLYRGFDEEIELAVNKSYPGK